MWPADSGEAGDASPLLLEHEGLYSCNDAIHRPSAVARTLPHPSDWALHRLVPTVREGIGSAASSSHLACAVSPANHHRSVELVKLALSPPLLAGWNFLLN